MIHPQHTPFPSTTRPPLVVALEGLDGTGKSSHIRSLSDMVSTWGMRVTTYQYTRRRIDWSGMLIHQLYASAAQGSRRRVLTHVRLLQEVLFSYQAYLNLRDLGDLNNYDLILCDRCAITAFIAHDRFFGSARIAHHVLTRLEARFVPDHVIYLQISPDTALMRIASRNDAQWNDENRTFLAAMQQRYLNLIDKRQAPAVLQDIIWHIVDAEADLPTVYDRLCTTLSSLLITEGWSCDETLPLSAPAPHQPMQPEMPVVS